MMMATQAPFGYPANVERPLVSPQDPSLPVDSMLTWDCSRIFQASRCEQCLVRPDPLDFLQLHLVLRVQVLACGSHGWILPERRSDEEGKQSTVRAGNTASARQPLPV